MLWKDNIKKIKVLAKSNHLIHAEIEEGCSSNWLLPAIYAIPRGDEKDKLWHNLNSFSNFITLPRVVIGDFNDICNQDEKKDGAPMNTTRCRIFQDRIQRFTLLDLGSFGPKFTWKDPKSKNYDCLYERLDRGICNIDWRLLFPNAMIRVLPRVHFFDHHPIMLSLKGKEGSITDNRL